MSKTIIKLARHKRLYMILVKHIIGKMNLLSEIGEISVGKDVEKRELYALVEM